MNAFRIFILKRSVFKFSKFFILDERFYMIIIHVLKINVKYCSVTLNFDLMCNIYIFFLTSKYDLDFMAL